MSPEPCTHTSAWHKEGLPCMICGDPPAEAEREDEREPDYDYTPYEETQSYRESMIDAGRGHLLR